MNYQKGRFLKVCQGPGQRSLLEQDVAREQGGEVREPFTFDSAGIHTNICLPFQAALPCSMHLTAGPHYWSFYLCGVLDHVIYMLYH